MSHHVTPHEKKINYVRDRSDGRQPVGFLVFAEFVLSPGGGGGGGVLTIFWVMGRLGPFDPPFSTYVEF